MQTAEITCRYCQGSGKDPFQLLSAISTCACCGGRGVVKVVKPYLPCPHCLGSGRIKRFRCTVCEGKGVIAKPTAELKTCQTCGGTGHDFHIPALECLDCRGRGFIILSRQTGVIPHGH
jgi:DnaJ-class molecular chaperone